MAEPTEEEARTLRQQLESGDYATRERADEYAREMARRKQLAREAAQPPMTARQAIKDTAEKAVTGGPVAAAGSARQALSRMQENLSQPLTPEEKGFWRTILLGPHHLLDSRAARAMNPPEWASGTPALAPSMHANLKSPAGVQEPAPKPIQEQGPPPPPDLEWASQDELMADAFERANREARHRHELAQMQRAREAAEREAYKASLPQVAGYWINNDIDPEQDAANEPVDYRSNALADTQLPGAGGKYTRR